MNKFLISVISALTLFSISGAFAQNSCQTVQDFQKDYPLGEITVFTPEQQVIVRNIFTEMKIGVPDEAKIIAVGKALLSKEGPVDPSHMIFLVFDEKGCYMGKVSEPTQVFIDMMSGKSPTTGTVS